MPLYEATPEVRRVLRLLIRANHILHKHGLVDAFGHISVRHPEHPNQYIIAGYDPGAPALVSSGEDFIVYYVENSEPVHGNQPQGYSERYIHGEAFKKHPQVQCVVHSHSEAVIPFTASGVFVKPVFHMAGFLGASPLEIFDIADYYWSAKECQADMLVKDPKLGSALASSLSIARPVVLQHRHGFTCIGNSIQQAVFRAIYTQKNCELLQKAIGLVKGDAHKVAYLSPKQASDCAVMNVKTEDKAFRLWLREVQVDALYHSEEGEPTDLPVGGMNPEAK